MGGWIRFLPEEEVVAVGWVTPVFKEAEEVVILAVQVAADLHGGLHFDEDGLGEEDFLWEERWVGGWVGGWVEKQAI